jgi:hypothetical protein
LPELCNQFLELRILVEAVQIVVGHQDIGIFVAKANTLPQILNCLVLAVSGAGYTGKGVPQLELISLIRSTCILLDRVAKQLARFFITMSEGQR